MLDGGSTESGLPYFVMEYVDGMPIRKYCDEHSLGIDGRLELFQKVCSAVSYAHQNLVVHRDLKPSNILINKEGQPKLLDFGIAKLLGPDWGESTAEATATQFRVMTPEYASPEQIEGKPATTAADVYSLGVVLYELLTGARPFKTENREPIEIAKAVLSSEPQKPSAAISRRTSNNAGSTAGNGTAGTPRPIDSRSLTGDLDNIVLKALRREPERRYQSVAEFSDDIRRYLTGLPVTATADSKLYRFSKYFKRHRASVIGTAAAALLLLAATGVATFQYTVAQREKAAAEKRFAETRVLAKSMLYDLHDKIEQLSGSTAAREFLIESALKYIDGLAAEKTDDPDLQTELADAYQRIADIQGGLWRPNLGQREKAEENYSKATAILEGLVEKHPERYRLKWKLSQLYAAAADSAYQRTDLASYSAFAEKAFEQVVPIESSFENDAYSEYYICDLIGAYHRSARAKAVNGDFEGAYALGLKGRDIATAAKLRFPQSPEVANALGVIEASFAELLTAMKRYDEAIEIYYASLETQKKDNIPGRETAQIERNLVVTYSAVAKIEGLVGRFSEAISNIDKAIAIASRMSAADPKNADGKLILANIRSAKGAIMQAAGNDSAAISVLIPVLEDWKMLRSADPSNQIVRFMESDAYGALGKAYLARGVATKARADLLAAYEMLQKAYDTSKEFRDAGLTTGPEAAETDVLAEKLAQCRAALNQAGDR
jgi:eukaryotic-like serine/threonine-protein kinase